MLLHVPLYAVSVNVATWYEGYADDCRNHCLRECHRFPVECRKFNYAMDRILKCRNSRCDSYSGPIAALPEDTLPAASNCYLALEHDNRGAY